MITLFFVLFSPLLWNKDIDRKCLCSRQLVRHLAFKSEDLRLESSRKSIKKTSLCSAGRVLHTESAKSKI